MEMLLLPYALITIIAVGILIYMKLDNKNKLGCLSNIPGGMLLLMAIAFVLSSTAIILFVIDFDNRLITFLNTMCNLLLLVCIVSLNRRQMFMLVDGILPIKGYATFYMTFYGDTFFIRLFPKIHLCQDLRDGDIYHASLLYCFLQLYN